MISYTKFKELFDSIDSSSEPEIELYFKNKHNTYMIIKYYDYISFQRCGNQEEQSGEIQYKSLDILYNSRTIDNIVLKDEWKNIQDILFDGISVAKEENILKKSK